MKYYRQCALLKGNTHQTAWLEEKPGLRVGVEVELKSEKAGDKTGWKVMSIGGRVDQDFLDLHRAKVLTPV